MKNLKYILNRIDEYPLTVEEDLESLCETISHAAHEAGVKGENWHRWWHENKEQFLGEELSEE